MLSPLSSSPSAADGVVDLGLLAEAVAEARTSVDIFRALWVFAQRLTPADGLIVASYDPIRQERTCVFSATDGEEDDVSDLPRLPLNGGPQSRAIAAGDVVVIADLAVDLTGQQTVLLGMETDPRRMRSSMAVPMRARGKIIGAFELQCYEPGGFGLRHVPAFNLAADIAALAIENVRAPASARHRAGVEADRGRLAALIRDRQFTPVFQPVVDIQTGRAVGYEALTRFTGGEDPHQTFQVAAASGLGTALEEATLRAAIDASLVLDPQAWLSLNASPQMILSHEPLNGMVASIDRPTVLEITEHAAVGNYALFLSSLGRIASPVELAIDDAGAGYASFRHILELRPRYVKLDRALIQGLDTDSARLALVRGLADFTIASGATLIAEGVETKGECDALRRLGVPLGQGYYFGRPQPAWAAASRLPLG